MTGDSFIGATSDDAGADRGPVEDSPKQARFAGGGAHSDSDATGDDARADEDDERADEDDGRTDEDDAAIANSAL